METVAYTHCYLYCISKLYFEVNVHSTRFEFLLLKNTVGPNDWLFKEFYVKTVFTDM